MSSIDMSPRESDIRKRAGVRKMVKHHLRIDMTPMVDLGFLLISFFVITTQLAKPTEFDLAMPKDGPPSEIGESGALTVLIDDYKMFCYEGEWKKAVASGTVRELNFSDANDLRHVIETKQEELAIANKNDGRNGLMVLIKPTKQASYKQVVDVLDEMSISLVKRYALLRISNEENTWLDQRQ